MWEERTLVIIKPDGVMMGFEQQIRKRYLDTGLRIVKELTIRMSEPLVRKFYKNHDDKFFFAGLVLAMTSGPSVVLILEGKDAVRIVRELNGATDPSKAEPGTIRHDFKSAGGPFNTVHGSDSISAFVREASIFGMY